MCCYLKFENGKISTAPESGSDGNLTGITDLKLIICLYSIMQNKDSQ